MGTGDRVPHPRRAHHHRHTPGVHPALRRARTVDAHGRHQRRSHQRRGLARATESTVFGPFFVADAPEIPLGGDIARGATGNPCHVSGTVRSTDGTALPGARIQVWEADDDGFYDVQYDDDRSAGRAWLRSGDDGEYRFWSVLPAPYPIPDDGPVGDLLKAASRGPMRPAHLHYKVDAPGHRTLITHAFLAGDDSLDRDAVFGVKDSLVVDVLHHPPGRADDGTELDRPWHTITFDITLAKDTPPA